MKSKEASGGKDTSGLELVQGPEWESWGDQTDRVQNTALLSRSATKCFGKYAYKITKTHLISSFIDSKTHFTFSISEMSLTRPGGL